MVSLLISTYLKINHYNDIFRFYRSDFISGVNIRKCQRRIKGKALRSDRVYFFSDVDFCLEWLAWISACCANKIQKANNPFGYNFISSLAFDMFIRLLFFVFNSVWYAEYRCFLFDHNTLISCPFQVLEVNCGSNVSSSDYSFPKFNSSKSLNKYMDRCRINRNKILFHCNPLEFRVHLSSIIVMCVTM